MSSPIRTRFSVAYRRLCHFVALRKDTVTIQALEDRLLTTALFLFPENASPTNEDLRNNLRDAFGLEFSLEEVAKASARLMSAGVFVKSSQSGFSLEPNAAAILGNQIEAAQTLEFEVKAAWIEQCLEQRLFEPQNAEQAWKALCVYLGRLFADYGLQTLELIAPSAVSGDDVGATTTHALKQIAARYLPELSLRNVSAALGMFLREPSDRRRRYLSQLVDGTFSFFALTVDREAAELLRKKLPPLKLVVDTNFVFGLLDLHTNPLVTVAKDLIELVTKAEFPFTFHYHPLTALEIRAVVQWHQRELSRRQWPQYLSRALIVSNANHLSGVARRFHEVNALTPTSVTDFFARYSNIERVLDHYHIKIHRNRYEPMLEEETTLELMSKYKAFLEPREKRFETIQHDIVLWRTLQEMRGNNPGPLGAGAFFLSCDYNLWRFDRKMLKRDGQMATVVLPNILLQIMRPFMPRAENFDAGFVQTFALPEFRTIGDADDAGVQNVASTLALYANVDEELATALLADEALIRRSAEFDEDDPALRELVESSLAEEVRRLREEKERIETERTALHDKWQALMDDLAGIGREREEARLRLEQETARANEGHSALQDVTKRLAEEQRRREAAESEVKAALRQADDQRNRVEMIEQRAKAAEEAEESSRHAREQLETRIHAEEMQRTENALRRQRSLRIAAGIGQVVVSAFTYMVCSILLDGSIFAYVHLEILIPCGCYGVTCFVMESLNSTRWRRSPWLIRVLAFVMLLAIIGCGVELKDGYRAFAASVGATSLLALLTLLLVNHEVTPKSAS
jgi:hypothetical protein